MLLMNEHFIMSLISVFIGRSGSGKTACFKHALYYLSLASGSTTNQLLTVERINAIQKILESFGNTRTLLNSNASRFTQIMSLDFDYSGVVVSASIQVSKENWFFGFSC